MTLCFFQSGPQLAMMFKHYQESRNRKYSEIFTYAIDAVWAVALTLQAALQSPDGAPLLDDFQQPSQNLSKILFREMTNLKFYGASVRVFSYWLAQYIVLTI